VFRTSSLAVQWWDAMVHQPIPLTPVHLGNLFHLLSGEHGLLGWEEFKRAMYLLGKVRLSPRSSSRATPRHLARLARPRTLISIHPLASTPSQGYFSDSQRKHLLRGMTRVDSLSVRPVELCACVHAMD
jgi:hypothetical protein